MKFVGPQKPEHPDLVKQLAVAMALLQFVQLSGIFLSHLWVAYLQRGFIMLLMGRIGITVVCCLGKRRLCVVERVDFVS